MNSKNNQRFQQTEQKIRDIFIELLIKKKDLSRITVTELCQAAGINRAAFYLHHVDIYDLLECIEADMHGYFITLFSNSNSKGEYSLRDRYLHLFSFLKEHQDFYRIYFNSRNHPQILDYTFFPESQRQKFEQMFEINEPLEYEYCQTFFIAGLTSTIQKWLNGGCLESEAELLRILERQLSFSQKMQSLLC